MKKIITFILIACLCLIPIDSWAKNKEIDENEIVREDSYLLLEDFKNDGYIDGSLYIGCENFINNGTLAGDLYAAFDKGLISGSIDGDIKVMGNVIDVNSSVKGEIITASHTFNLLKEATIDEDIKIMGEKANVLGNINGDVVIKARKVTFGAIVRGDVDIQADEINILPSTIIEGDLRYSCDKINGDNLTINHIKGDIKRYEGKKISVIKTGSKNAGVISLVLYLLRGVSYISQFLIGLLLLYLFKFAHNNMIHEINKNTLKIVVVGSIYIFTIPFFCIVLLLTIIGIPVSIFTGLIYGFTLYISKVPVSIWLGNKILYNKKIYIKYIVGFVILLIIGEIPIIGVTIGLITKIVGSGVYVLSLYHNIRTNRKRIN